MLYNFNDDDIDFEESEILSSDSDETDFNDMELKDSLNVSVLEIYNETISDLLVHKSEAKSLKIKMDSKKKHFVKGLKHVEVTSATQVFGLILKAQSNRAQSATFKNQHSSRSHMILTLTINHVDE